MIDEERLLLSLSVSLVLALAAAAVSIAAAVTDRFPGDLDATAAFQALDWSWLRALMLFGQEAGKVVVLALAAAAGVSIAALRREWAAATGMAVAAAAYSSEPVLKLLVARPRPDPALVATLVDTNGFSFPSGHALGSGLVFGAVYAFVPVLFPAQRGFTALLRAAVIVLLVMISASRVYLGAHWASDVLGGWLIAGAVLATLRTIYRWRTQRWGSLASPDRPAR